MPATKYASLLLILLLVSVADSPSLFARSYSDYYTIGNQYYDTLQFTKAIVYFKKGIASNQGKVKCLTGLGRVYYKQENYKAAKEQFEAALKLDPKNYLANKWKGKLLVDEGKYKKSIEYFNRAIAAQPDNDSPYVFRAGSYSVLKQDKLALADLNKAIQLKPEPRNYINRAEIFRNLKMYRQAIEDYKRGQKGEWNKDIVYHRIAYCYEKLGKLKEALNEFNALLKINAADDEARAKRARIYLKLNQPAKALEDLNFAINNYPFGEPRHLYRLRAEAYKKLGLLEKAKQDTIKASREN